MYIHVTQEMYIKTQYLHIFWIHIHFFVSMPAAVFRSHTSHVPIFSLFHTATYGNTRQHTATSPHIPLLFSCCCNTRQHMAIHGNTRQHTTTYRNILQYVATQVSGANFLGEIIEWSGFALATASFEASGIYICTYIYMHVQVYIYFYFYIHSEIIEWRSLEPTSATFEEFWCVYMCV